MWWDPQPPSSSGASDADPILGQRSDRVWKSPQKSKVQRERSQSQLIVILLFVPVGPRGRRVAEPTHCTSNPSRPTRRGVFSFLFLCNFCGPVAQLVEHRIEDPSVGGSTPPGSMFLFGSAVAMVVLRETVNLVPQGIGTSSRHRVRGTINTGGSTPPRPISLAIYTKPGYPNWQRSRVQSAKVESSNLSPGITEGTAKWLATSLEN